MEEEESFTEKAGELGQGCRSKAFTSRPSQIIYTALLFLVFGECRLIGHALFYCLLRSQGLQSPSDAGLFHMSTLMPLSLHPTLLRVVVPEIFLGRWRRMTTSLSLLPH